jgi:predicted ArsR family transcriptional regulator
MAIPLPLIERREMEARAFAPLFKALAAELGETRARTLFTDVIAQVAHQAGSDAAAMAGGRQLSELKTVIATWCEMGALEMTVLRDDEEVFEFHVTRCRFAEMYHRLGLAELGPILSCNRDGALVEGFNPEIAFTRTQTIMTGAPHCNFRYELPKRS